MSAYSRIILQDGPLAYWRLGELSGTSAADSSGHAHTGTYNSVTLGQAGAIAGDNDAAAKFSGAATSYMDGGVSLSLVTFTLEAWIYKTAAGVGTIMGQINSGATDATCWWTLSGGAGAGFTTSTNNFVFITLGDVSLSTWHHVALTYDGSFLRFYVDAVLTANAPRTGTPEAIGSHMIVGRLGDYTGGQAFPGLIDEAAVYNFALSQARITAHYKAGIEAGRIVAPVGNSPFIKQAA